MVHRAWLVELYLSALSKWTHYTANIPTFVFLLGSGAIGQGVISWLHRSSPHPVTATSAPTPASGSRPISREALRAAARAHGIGKGEERKDR
jgi:hypothetical protein